MNLNNIKTICYLLMAIIISGCAAPKLKYSYSGISGDSVQEITESFLRERRFTVQKDEVKTYTIFAKSEIRNEKTFFGRDILEWDEITIIAKEWPVIPVRVDLLVQVQVWEQKPLGEKQLIESVSNTKRLEGEQALRELDNLIRQNGEAP